MAFHIGLDRQCQGSRPSSTRYALQHRVLCEEVLGINKDDITLSVPKLFFGYATGTNLLFPFAVGGATALFAERSTAETMFEMIHVTRPTILTSVPTMINAMLQVDGASDRYDLSSLRFCLSAGEALPPELYQRWMETFGVEILDGIGSAEMFHIYITNYPGDVVPGSLGRIVPGYEATIVDAEGRELPAGEMGTLKSRVIRRRCATGTHTRHPRRLLRATGARPAISFEWMRGLLLVLRPHGRDAESRRHLCVADRDRELPGRARRGARMRGDRRNR